MDPATIKQKRNNKLRHFDGHCDQGVIREIIDPDEVLNSTSKNNENISNANIVAAVEQFVYLNFCPNEEFKERVQNLKFLFVDNDEPKRLILELNRLMNRNFIDSNYKAIVRKIYEESAKILGLKGTAIAKFLQEGARNETVDDIFGDNYEEIHQLIHHPAHIIDEDGNKNPSALIPFCQFGYNTGRKDVDGFLYPLCDMFKRKVYRKDQLCYQVDLNDYNLDHERKSTFLKTGLFLWLDYNEDLEIMDDKASPMQQSQEYSFTNQILSISNIMRGASVYIDSIGRLFFFN